MTDEPTGDLDVDSSPQAQDIVEDDSVLGEFVDGENYEPRSVIAQATRFSGPLPPPQLLQGYEDVLPGAAERILRMTEKQLDHNIKMEEAESRDQTELVKTSTQVAKRAQLFTFVLVVLFLVLAFVAVLKGQELASVAAGIAAIGTIGYALLGGRKNEKEADPEEDQPTADV